MSYTFVDHWYTFTDRQRIYQNVHDYLFPSESGIPYTTSREPVEQLVDSVIDSYVMANKQLGFDFDNANTETVRTYGNLISQGTNASPSQVMMILGIIEAGLKSGLIDKPFLKLQSRASLQEPSFLDKAEDLLANAGSGAETIIKNVGGGIVDMSELFKNLPMLLGTGAILYYFLMIAPKTKKG